MENEFAPEDILKHKNYIVGGLGGGADVFNAFPLWARLRHEGKNVTLVGVNGSSPNIIEGGKYITNFAKWVTPSSKKSATADRRVFEHMAAKALVAHFDEVSKNEARVAYISRRGGIEGIAHALDIIAEDTKSTCIILVDGGGDSLFCDSHNNEHSAKYSSDSDTMVIDALCGVVRAECYVGVVSCGIDTPKDYEEILSTMADEGAFIGQTDMRDFPTEVLEPTLRAIRASIKMNSKDEGDRDVSHTVTGLFCSFKGMFKKVRTLASWSKESLHVKEDFTVLRYFTAYDMARVKHSFQTKVKPPPSNPKKHSSSPGPVHGPNLTTALVKASEAMPTQTAILEAAKRVDALLPEASSFAGTESTTATEGEESTHEIAGTTEV